MGRERGTPGGGACGGERWIDDGDDSGGRLEREGAPVAGSDISERCRHDAGRPSSRGWGHDALGRRVCPLGRYGPLVTTQFREEPKTTAKAIPIPTDGRSGARGPHRNSMRAGFDWPRVRSFCREIGGYQSYQHLIITLLITSKVLAGGDLRGLIKC